MLPFRKGASQKQLFLILPFKIFFFFFQTIKGRELQVSRDQDTYLCFLSAVTKGWMWSYAIIQHWARPMNLKLGKRRIASMLKRETSEMKNSEVLLVFLLSLVIQEVFLFSTWCIFGTDLLPVKILTFFVVRYEEKPSFLTLADLAFKQFWFECYLLPCLIAWYNLCKINP